MPSCIEKVSQERKQSEEQQDRKRVGLHTAAPGFGGLAALHLLVPADSFLYKTKFVQSLLQLTMHIKPTRQRRKEKRKTRRSQFLQRPHRKTSPRRRRNGHWLAILLGHWLAVLLAMANRQELHKAVLIIKALIKHGAKVSPDMCKYPFGGRVLKVE